MVKKFLFVMRRAPQAGLRVRETLDLILTTAAFDQSVSLVFLDDGVYQLKRGQHPAAAGLPPVAPLFEALALYDVENIWVESESLAERGLDLADLLIPARPVGRCAVAALVAEHDVAVPG